MNFIRSTFSPIEQMCAATAIFALVLSLVSGGFSVAQATQMQYPNNPNITICHAAASKTNPYQMITVDASSIINNPNGHNYHDDEGLLDKGDIIPPFAYDLGDGAQQFPGKNWTTDFGNGLTGEDIFESECEVPQPEVPGCTDKDATNYNKDATTDDGSCLFPLTIHKIISGTTDKTFADFSFQIDGGDQIAFESDGINVISVANGTYTVTEVAVAGFTTTYQNCDDIVINGAGSSCTILNTVDTDPQCEYPYTGEYPDCVPPPCPDGYTGTYPDCVPPVVGCMDSDAENFNPLATVEDNSCTYKLTVKKLFAGNYDVAYSAFAFEVNDGDSTAFDTDGINELVLLGGVYTVNETPTVSYTPSYDECAGIVLDGPKTCTITNTYVPEVIPGCMDQDANNYVPTANTPTSCTYDLTVKKLIIGSDAPADDFSFVVDATDPTAFDVTGVNVVSVSQGAHAVTEVPAVGFDVTYDAGCTIADMTSPVTCTITNTAIVNPDICTVTLMSDEDNTTVIEKDGAYAQVLSWTHPAWDAVMGGAQWIWGDNPVADPVAETNQTFVRTFGWGGDSVTSALLEIASDNSHNFDVNGTLGGDASEANYSESTKDSYNVMSAINSGNNTLTIAVKNWAQANGTVESNPAGLKYRLTITGTGSECDIPYDDEPTYTIDGYKWNDADGDGDWGDDEVGIPGWTIHATDGEQTLTTQTDETGHYLFEVEAGTWTVSEEQKNDWEQTAPDPETTDGVCSGILGGKVILPLSPDPADDDSTDIDITRLECNFGNHEHDDGSDPELACSISASDTSINEDDDVTIYWDTTRADSVTLNGEVMESVDGSKLFENLQNDTTYTLVATEDVEDGDDNVVECSVTVEVDEDNGGGGSSSGSKKRKTSTTNDPVGEVLGESTSVLPVGAPNTGSGGAAQSPITSLVALLGMLMSLVTLRVTRHG